jgi:Mrp family chromosome partitioning ATPase/capsular polysaccharide biosynthesis protein
VHDLGLREYLQILRRRKWIVIQAMIIVPLAAVAFSLRQSALYESSADVLLRYQSLPSTLSGISDPNSYSYYVDPVRSTDTSLQIASLPLVANRVSDALRKQGVPTADVGNTGVAEVGDTDVIRFTSSTGDPKTAAAIATEYARQFTLYFAQLDNSSINQAITGLQSRIDELQLQGTRSARLQAAGLQSKINQLQTLQTLQTSSAVLVRTASGAAKIRPTPRKYAVLGIVLGFVLGIGLAFLREAFDTRLRSGAQIAGILKLPILARVPAPPKKLERERQLVMIEAPTSSGADAFRRLRMNLEFASIGKPSQVVMFTSAMPQEGKSTTLANLGVALALAGKQVAIVDLDLHRPMQERFFEADHDHPGLTSVVLGEVSLDEALLDIPLDDLSRNTGRSSAAQGRGVSGSLSVLPAGILPPDPGEFVGLEGVGRVIAALRERVDIVLLDAPPLLAIGDGLTIAGFADAIVAIVRSDVARRPLAAELAGTLSRLPAAKLGFVLCGESGLDGQPYYAYGRYGYGYGSASHEEAVN